jgi:seryl-tRNA synthetase
MLDVKWIRANSEEFEASLAKRGEKSVLKSILQFDEERRQISTLIQQLQHARKEKAKFLSFIKDKNSNEFEDAKRDANHINDKLEELTAKLSNDGRLNAILEMIPNIPDSEVPYGTDESMNKLVREWGTIKKIENPLQHFELGEKLGMMDFAQTVRISGSRFVTLRSDLAKLERALANFMLDLHGKTFGFTEVSVPFLVRDQAMYNVGLLPKFKDESFETTNQYRLIPTGEVPLVNLVADKILSEQELPLRLVAHTPCFRSEAGSAGRDTRGMIRLHQFSKVELVTISTPEKSREEHEYLTNAAEEVLKRLNLPYRVMLLCSGDMGFQSNKTYDLEVWMPGQQKYREISSCSNCGDFQARRLKARYRDSDTKETVLVHTLNGSALAIGRTIAAILENYQNADGSITIPTVLVPYMAGVDRIEMMREVMA